MQDSLEGTGTHVTIVAHEDQSLVVLGVDADRLAKWLESMGCTTDVPHLAAPSKGHQLSSREREIVSLVGAGLSNAQIASRLFLSVNTLKSYIRSAYRKMGVETRAGAVRWAIRHDLAQADFDGDHRPIQERLT